MFAQFAGWLIGEVKKAVPRYYPHFICGFCYYSLLIVLLLLPIILMFGLVGSMFGVHLLFFHDDWVKQTFAGVSLGFYWAAVFFVGYVMCLRDLREGRLAPWSPPTAEPIPDACLPDGFTAMPPPTFREYCGNLVLHLGFTALLVVLIMLGLLGSLDLLGGSPDPTPADSTDWFYRWMNLCLPAGVLLGWGLLYLGWLCRGIAGQALGGIGAGLWWAASLGWSWLHAVGIDLQQDPRWVRRLMVLVWGGAIVLAFAYNPRRNLEFPHWRDWVIAAAPVVATIAGLVLTILAQDSLAERTGWPMSLFGLAALANVVLVLAASTYILSHASWGVVLAAPAALLLLALQDWYFSLLCPKRWKGTVTFVKEKVARGTPQEHDAVISGLGQFAFTASALGLVVTLPWLERLLSPVPVVMLFLLGMTALYGLTLYVIRRAVVWALGGLVVVGLVAHLQAYRMRFDELESYYRPDALVQLPVILDGADGVGGQDIHNQLQFDTLLTSYQRVDNKLFGQVRELNAAQVQRLLETNPARQKELDRKCQALEARANTTMGEWESLRKGAKDCWKKLEAENRVRAGRLSSSPLDNLERGAKLDGQVGLRAYLTGDLYEGPPLVPTSRIKYHQKGDKKRKGDPDNVLVVVTVSGGGIRSAYWTFTVLKELELGFAREGIDLPKRIRVICGASGGMLGASYYVTTLQPPEERLNLSLQDRKEELRRQQNALSSDFLTPLTQRMIITDVPGWLSPWPLKHDRGQELEKAWVKRLKAPRKGGDKLPLEMTFSDLRQGELEGWRPSLVFTPMMIEDSRRLVISNLDLRYAISNDGPTQSREENQPWADNLSIDAVEFFRLFPETHGSLPLSTAIRMSASFPFFSPAVSLPTKPRRRVVDAGYYDNYGVALAASWLFSRDTEAWMEQFDRVLLIQVRDGVTEKYRQLRSTVPDGSTNLTRSVEELTSPPEGMYNATFGSSSFRNDGLLELYSQFYDLRQEAKWRKRGKQTKGPGQMKPARRELEELPFLIANLEFNKKASLSWYLSQTEKNDIEEDGRALRKVIKRLTKWWKDGVIEPESVP
jgi:hypothetical protein